MPRAPFTGRITDGFGPREAPLPGASTWHYGVDGIGDGNLAPEDCVLVSYGYAGTYGYLATLEGRRTGVSHRLAHNRDASPIAPFGQLIGEGSKVSQMGSTGNSTGTHCHWEVLVNGARIDPMQWLAAYGSTAAGGSGVPLPPDVKDDEMRLFKQVFSDGNLAYVCSGPDADVIVSTPFALHLEKCLGQKATEVNEQDWDVYTRMLKIQRAARAAALDATLDDEQAELVALVKGLTVVNNGTVGTADPTAFAGQLLTILGPQLSGAIAGDLAARLEK